MSTKRDNDREKMQVNERDDASAVTTRSTKRKWAAVDIVVILALLFAVLGVAMRGFFEKREPQDTTVGGPFDVYFTVEEIHSSVLEEISGFDMLYLHETGELVGYIGVYADGTPAIASTGVLALPGGDWVSAQGCMVCLEGTMKEGSLLPYDMQRYISPGSVLTLRTERAVLTIQITKISVRN